MPRNIILTYVVLALFSFCPLPALANILVISPHPDDDVIISSGVIVRALQRGEKVHVVYMTNGDYSGINAGIMRQGEAVAAQGQLGMNEDDLVFLGYPDGYLNTLYTSYRTEQDVFTSPSGQSVTYGQRGLGRVDFHTFAFGNPASYNLPNMVLDIETIISDFLPDHIFVTSEQDGSGDHKVTYHVLRLALDNIFVNNNTYNPTIHKTIVWSSTDTSWPNPYDPQSYLREINNLHALGLNWNERESLDVPLSIQSTFYPENKKQLAEDKHWSQNGSSSFLGRFMHKDEIFWIEKARGTNNPPVVNAGLDQNSEEGQIIFLHGGASRDPDGDNLLFSWRQVSGVPVPLSGQDTESPYFTAPAGIPADEILSFELVVSDGEYSSVPDAVNVVVNSLVPPPVYVNVAPLATNVSGSSVYASSDIRNLVDGCLNGYPADSTCEWTSLREKAGAWFQLGWNSSVTIGKIKLYDRPNKYDQIHRAHVTFSDGTTMEIGPLENNGRAVEYTFPPRSITGLRVGIAEVSDHTSNIGLAEIEVFEATGDNINRAPLAIAGSSQVVAEGTTVYLDGSGSSDPDGDLLTYAWAQVSGQGVALSGTDTASPWFVAPTGLAADETLTFSLVASDGSVVSAPSQVTVTVTAANPTNQAPTADAGEPQIVDAGSTVYLDGSGSSDPDGDPLTYAWAQVSGPGVALTGTDTADPWFVAPTGLAADETLTFSLVASDSSVVSAPSTVAVTVKADVNPNLGTNIAGEATALASSQNTRAQQTAAKAIDGCIDGYPGDPSCEWATAYQQTVGNWLELRWDTPRIVDRIVLYDRPNTSDNIVGGTVTFSDGSSLTIGPLDPAGAGAEYVFAPRAVTWLRMTVDAVGSKTKSVGLAEIEVFENAQ